MRNEETDYTGWKDGGEGGGNKSVSKALMTAPPPPPPDRQIDMSGSGASSVCGIFSRLAPQWLPRNSPK